ncbi:MAG: type II toxin-antitoxin system RelE/ParE family toxin [Bacteroidales bacterium]|nr:type II toxin-antitoxin system RelE/ParE family toxin [Bacteroidales bacterium]
MKYEPRFDVVYNKDVYTFLESLPQKTQDKIASNIDKSRYVIDSELFKKLKGEIWEFRTIHNNTCIRLLAFWDKERGKVVVVTHGFIKKSEKTPQQEIRKAESLRLEYYKSKK